VTSERRKHDVSTETPIILVHSMFKPPITEGAVREALPAAQRSMPLGWVEIKPDYQRLEHYDQDYDWATAAAEQQRQFEERLEPLLEANPLRPLIYFGLAPIPLAFHLGTIVTHRYRLRVHQHHHVRSDWRWLSDFPRGGAQVVPPGDLGEDKSTPGDLVLRVSTSHLIEAQDTRHVLAGRFETAHSIDLRVREPDLDVFESEGDLEGFCAAFDNVVKTMGQRYPAARTLHLFAAVTCGVAFRMGTYYSNKKRLKPIQTYQYDQHREPRYAPALAIGSVEQASLLVLTADPAGWTPTSGLSELKTICDLFEPHCSRIKVSSVPGLVASDLQRRLDCHARILHFAGHGASVVGGVDGTRDLHCPEVAEPGALLLLGPQGQRIGLVHDDLVSIIKRGKPRGLRCVVLSACHSAELAERLVEEAGLEHAIGFFGAIDDKSAFEFSLAFYRSLLEHGIVEDAVEEGMRQIDLAGRSGRDQVGYFPQIKRNRRPLFY
jgi:hypothetical protein